MWMVEALVLMGIFVAFFYWLIHFGYKRLNGRRRLGRWIFGSAAALYLILIVDAGWGVLLPFFLFFLGLASVSYLLFLNGRERAGVVGLVFCLVFSVLFAFMRFFILNVGF